MRDLGSGLGGVVAAALLGLVVAGCGAAGPSPSAGASEPTPAASVWPAVPVSSDVPAGTLAISLPSPAPSQTAARATPPAARLDGLAGGSGAPGSLGSYTWNGSGTDAPWIVGSRAGGCGRAAALRVVFAEATPGAWTDAWAKVAHGVADRPASASDGSGPVSLQAPATPGDWTLRVSATFGEGRSATYYWRIAVAP